MSEVNPTNISIFKSISSDFRWSFHLNSSTHHTPVFGLIQSATYTWINLVTFSGTGSYSYGGQHKRYGTRSPQVC